MEKIKIIKEPDSQKPYIVIYKPKNLPSAPLTADDKNNALSQTIELYPEITKVIGRKPIEYGLLHRLDTPTDGLIVIAATQEAYDFLQSEQKAGRFLKYYQAQCNKLPESISEYAEGFPAFEAKTEPESNITIISSYFRSYGEGNKEVRPVTEKSGKAALKKLGSKKIYTTECKILSRQNDLYNVECKIREGYRHQVRCHLAWSGMPITGDVLYNPDKKNAENLLRFSATKVEFEYPKGDLNSYEITFTWT